LSIETLRVDCHGCWEKGQVYTALSRAMSLKGLEVVNLKPEYIKTDERVVRFYQEYVDKDKLRDVNQTTIPEFIEAK
jgi:hypothetical protein